MEPKRVFDLIPYRIHQKGKNNIVFTSYSDEEWHDLTANDYAQKVDLMASALLSKGIRKGDKVALIAGSRPEWNITDMAILSIGAIDVAIYPTISPAEYEYILNHAEVKALIIENEHLLHKIEPIATNTDCVQNIFTIDKVDDTHLSFDDLLDEGRQHLDEEKLQQLRDSIDEQDIATIIYTSGTTGNPKGVMLTHRNFLQQAVNIKKGHIFNLNRDRRALSFLPLCHVFERTLVYSYQYLGLRIFYARSLGSIIEDIQTIRPQVMTTVPRVLEKVYLRLRDKGKKLTGVNKRIYFWSVGVANRYNVEHRSLWYRIKHLCANVLVYRRWRKALGGDFDFIISGGSAISPQLSNFFDAIGWPIFQGYGMSETSPVISVSNRLRHGRIGGSVGPALPGVQIRIDSVNNEVCCKGHGVMKGYYKAPELTAEIIDSDGWLHTGDAGYLDRHGRLFLTGRIKSLFKTSLGKYINPDAVEEKLHDSPLISNILVVGENQRFPAAIIVPEFTALREAAEKQRIACGSDEDIVHNKAIERLMLKEIRRFDKYFGDWEQVKRIRLVNDEWSPATGVITPTLKLKRGKLMHKYEDVIKELFD
ncbi:MAG: long-chain fatty acid--CoA ligase [Paludibacteraceae bacterium]|nr:long-chain fatty acid--CoA ligase [Paludibacteraceae bacterium]